MPRPNLCWRPRPARAGSSSGRARIRATAAAAPRQSRLTKAGASPATPQWRCAPMDDMTPRDPSYRWWQRGTIYQVYPRSFMDLNGDGVGGLGGIVARLDHLRSLGVDAMWISPIFPSPMKDFGYDVADYTGIHPMFGTLEDFDRLLREARARGLEVILDFVPNHSSDQHAWFLESRASRDNPRRDWYLWRDPSPGGGPPNQLAVGLRRRPRGIAPAPPPRPIP